MVVKAARTQVRDSKNAEYNRTTGNSLSHAALECASNTWGFIHDKFLIEGKNVTIIIKKAEMAD